MTYQSSQSLAYEQLPSVLQLQTILGKVTTISRGIQHVLGNSNQQDVKTTMDSVQADMITFQQTYAIYLSEKHSQQQDQLFQSMEAQITAWGWEAFLLA